MPAKMPAKMRYKCTKNINHAWTEPFANNSGQQADSQQAHRQNPYHDSPASFLAWAAAVILCLPSVRISDSTRLTMSLGSEPASATSENCRSAPPDGSTSDSPVSFSARSTNSGTLVCTRMTGVNGVKQVWKDKRIHVFLFIRTRNLNLSLGVLNFLAVFRLNRS